MILNKKLLRAALIAGVSAVAIASAAIADETAEFDISAGGLPEALAAYIEQSGEQIIYRVDHVRGVRTKGVNGRYDAREALEILLSETGFDIRRDPSGAAVVVKESEPEKASQAEITETRLAQAGQAIARTVDAQSDAVDEDEEEEREQIVVTGTNIRGVAPDSSPSFVFDREDIAKTGFSTVSEFVQSLPQNFSGGSNPATITGGGLPNDRSAVLNQAFGSSVNLRGLGSGSTLVLLNGSRLAPAGRIGDFVDVSMIPLSAVERVEVLTDGASAIYGADAIAGVVNFVLRDDYDGAETFVRIGSVTDGDLSEYRAGQTFGKSWGSGSALVSYEFFRRDSLGAEERDFSSSVPLPSTLLPEQQSHNILLTGSQELSDRISLRGHGTFSQRDGSSASNAAGGLLVFFDESRTKQHGGTVGADIQLWSDWILDVSGGYHKVTESIERTVTFPAMQEVDSDLWSIDGKIDGTLVRLPGGDLKIATGVSYREEALSFTFDSDNLAQDNRSVLGAFGEVFIPIVGADNRMLGIERLELTVAGRYDDYSDFGDTFNPKIGLLWSPFDGLNFRATYSTSFNPPNLGDTGASSGDAAVAPAPNPAVPAGFSLVLLDRRSTRDLQPEESTAFTAGFDFRKEFGLGSLDISTTWFDISYTDRISRAGEAFFFLLDPDQFADLIIANPDPSFTAAIIADAVANDRGFFDFTGGLWTTPGDEDFVIIDRLLNLSRADTSGLDVNLAYSLDGDDFGQFNIGLNSTYLFKQESKITANSPVFDVVDTVFNPVDLRLRGSTGWSRDGINAVVFVNYTDGYVDNRNILGMGDVPVDSWTTVDVSLSFDTSGRAANKWLDNTRFTLSVLNLFDQDPPRIEIANFAPTGFDTTNANPLGRFIAFQVTKAW